MEYPISQVLDYVSHLLTRKVSPPKLTSYVLVQLPGLATFQ